MSRFLEPSPVFVVVVTTHGAHRLCQSASPTQQAAEPGAGSGNHRPLQASPGYLSGSAPVSEHTNPFSFSVLIISSSCLIFLG